MYPPEHEISHFERLLGPLMSGVRLSALFFSSHANGKEHCNYTTFTAAWSSSLSPRKVSNPYRKVGKFKFIVQGALYGHWKAIDEEGRFVKLTIFCNKNLAIDEESRLVKFAMPVLLQSLAIDEEIGLVKFTILCYKRLAIWKAAIDEESRLVKFEIPILLQEFSY